MKRFLIPFLILAPAFAAAQVPAALSPEADGGVAEAAPAAGGEKKDVSALDRRNDPTALAANPFSMTFEFDHSVGSGTFVNSRYYSSVVGSLVVSPAYNFNAGPVRVRASTRLGAAYEYSLPDTDNGRRYSFTDVPVVLAAPGLFKKAGFIITPDVRVSLPLSHESRFATLIAGAGVGVGTLYTGALGGKLMLSHRISFTKNFHQSQVPPQSAGRISSPDFPATVCRAGEDACGGGNASNSFSIANSGFAQFAPTDAFAFGFSLAVSNGFRYQVAPEGGDEFTSKTLDSTGRPAAKGGFGRNDLLSGSLFASYQFGDHLSLSFGFGRQGSPLTPDNRNFRNPFFDTTAAADNATSYSLTLSGFY